MVASSFQSALNFVWAPGRDDPTDGYHVTPGDSGGGTFGGVIEATWTRAVELGIVPPGELMNATVPQLSDVMHAMFWLPVCDVLPAGLDFMYFNGTMMTGHYPHIFQQCLGFFGSDDDGAVGHMTTGAAIAADSRTLINALHGTHIAYLRGLSSWGEFGGGWTTRLVACRKASLATVPAGPLPAPPAPAPVPSPEEITPADFLNGISLLAASLQHVADTLVPALQHPQTS